VVRRMASASRLGAAWVVLRTAFLPRVGISSGDFDPSFGNRPGRFLGGLAICHLVWFVVSCCLTVSVEHALGLVRSHLGWWLRLQAVALVFECFRITAAYGCPALVAALLARRLGARRMLADEWFSLAVLLFVGSLSAECVGEILWLLHILGVQRTPLPVSTVILDFLLNHALPDWLRGHECVDRSIIWAVTHISEARYVVFASFVIYVLRKTLRSGFVASMTIWVTVSVSGLAIAQAMHWCYGRLT
jgi:hypothetical protein